MSATARWIIAIFAGACAVSFATVALVVPPGVMSKPGLWIMTGFCGVIVLACFENPVRIIAGRIIGATICVTYIIYIFSEIGHPLPTWTTYRAGDTNLINAIIGFVVFGIPAGYIALTGRLPDTTVKPAHPMPLADDDLEDDGGEDNDADL